MLELYTEGEMEKNSEQKIDSLKAEEKTEEETGTSLFHHLMAQRKDVEEDMVCMKLQTRD